MTAATPTSRRNLVIYEDLVQLLQARSAATGLGLVGLTVELSSTSRLGGERRPLASGGPMICAQIANHAPARVLAIVERHVERVLGEVVYVVHIDDLAAFVPHLGKVDRIRVLGRPLDAEDPRWSMLPAPTASDLASRLCAALAGALPEAPAAETAKTPATALAGESADGPPDDSTDRSVLVRPVADARPTLPDVFDVPPTRLDDSEAHSPALVTLPDARAWSSLLGV